MNAITRPLRVLLIIIATSWVPADAVGQAARSPNAPAYTRPRAYNFYGALWTMGVKGTFESA